MDSFSTMVGGDLFSEDGFHVFDSDNKLVGIASLENGQWYARNQNGLTKVPCSSRDTAIQELKKQSNMGKKSVEKRNTDQLTFFFDDK